MSESAVAVLLFVGLYAALTILAWVGFYKEDKKYKYKYQIKRMRRVYKVYLEEIDDKGKDAL